MPLGIQPDSSAELNSLLCTFPNLLSQARLELSEKVAPMSLHIGLIRVAVGNSPILDILCDTSDAKLRVYATLVFGGVFSRVLQKLADECDYSFGVQISLDITK